MEKLVSDRIKLSRTFKKEANGTISDSTKAKPNVNPELAKYQALAEQAKAGLESFQKQIKLKEQQIKLNELKTKQLKLDNDIEATERVMLKSHYSDSEVHKKAEGTRKELKAKKMALSKELSELGYGEVVTGTTNASLTSQPDKLYYVRAGDYYFFLRNDTVWVKTASDNRWAWLFVPMLNRLSNDEEYRLLIEKKYSLVELKQRFSFHFPSRWDLGSPFDSDGENDMKQYNYNRMHVDLTKATILY